MPKSYQLLIKDPEIHSKTWILEISKYATIAEVVGQFLLRRGGGHVSQPCLLRMSYGNLELTNPKNMDRTLLDMGLPTRGVSIHTMWSVSAGHISSKCDGCQSISNLVLLSQTKSITSGTKSTITQNVISDCHQLNSSCELKQKFLTSEGSNTRLDSPSSKHGVKKGSKHKSNNKNVVTNDKEISITAAEPINIPRGSSTVEIMKSLESMVTACFNAVDIVGKLEKLTEMRHGGELNDIEYCKAKARLLD